jgi:hypothetical protein
VQCRYLLKWPVAASVVGLKRRSAGEFGQALFTHEPGADPHVKMQPIFDDLAFGLIQEE